MPQKEFYGISLKECIKHRTWKIWNKMAELKPSYNLKQMKISWINEIKLNESKTWQYVICKSKKDTD